ncbi:MAG: hypothetical protein QY323_02840 [Patescibacteria group bacterium]|nr:MAG: hypothetical protein QY323_02840 [Patescibacteria group bacterium]
MKIHPSAVPKNGTHITWNIGVNDDAHDSSTQTGVTKTGVIRDGSINDIGDATALV